MPSRGLRQSCAEQCAELDRNAANQLHEAIVTESASDKELMQKIRGGNEEALGRAFTEFGDRLRRIVRFRLDYRLAGRVAESDVIQETYLAAAKRLDHLENYQEMPLFLWLRLLVSQKLTDLHRVHLKAEKRDVRREVALMTGPSAHTSVAIAANLIGAKTGASALLEKAEQIEELEKVLNKMDETDREVIALRHFEELSNIETARVLDIAPTAASKRYVRAMARLAELMSEFQA